MVTVSTDRFTYNKDEQTFVAEVSDLQLPPGDGIALVSAQTGRVTALQVVNVERDREQEVTAWVLRSVDPELRDLFTVHLLND